MGIAIFRDKENYLSYCSKKTIKRRFVEGFIAKYNKSKKNWNMFGFCEVCEKPTRFKIGWSYSDGKIPNFREWLICDHCGLNNRQRFVASYIKKKIKNNELPLGKIYVYEQVTSFYEVILNLDERYEVIGSEYLGFDKRPGEIIHGIRHEDAMCLSFKDKSISLISSNDVYEHVPSIERSFAEAARVLSSGGLLLFTVPFHCMNKITKKRADFVDGQIKYMAEPHFHDNPIDSKGSLVFHDIGWDVLTMCKDAGFTDAFVMGYYSFFYGYIGEGIQIIFIAQK